MKIITNFPEVERVIRLAVDHGLIDPATRTGWIRILAILVKFGIELGDLDTARAVALTLSESFPNFDQVSFDEQWNDLVKTAQNHLHKLQGIGSLIRELKEAGVKWASVVDALAVADAQFDELQASWSGNHPYFVRKQLEFPTGGEAVHDGQTALIRYLDIHGKEFRGYQRILSDGSKRWVKGSRKVGSVYDATGEFLSREGLIRVDFVEGVADQLAIRQAAIEAGDDRFTSGRETIFTCADCGNLLPVAREIIEARPELEVVVCVDRDAAGLRAAAQIAAELPMVRFALPPGGAKDLDDARREVGAVAVLAALTDAAYRPEALSPMPAGRLPAGPGRPKRADQREVIEALRGLEGKAVCRVYEDVFEDQTFVRWGDDDPLPLTDRHTTRLVTELEGMGLRNVSRDTVRWGIDFIAGENQVDSLKASIEALPEPTEFIDPTELFIRYMGAADTPLYREAGKYLLTKALDRGLNPGCMSEIVVVLLGDQGCGKSRFTRYLPWVESHAGKFSYHVDGADRIRQSRGRWILEWAETSGLRKREVEYIKDDISTTQDSWVPKFCETAKVKKRQYVLVGSSNDRELFTDATGNRRYVIAEVGKFDEGAWLRDRENVWASALQVYRQQGCNNFRELERLAAEVEGQYMAVDPWRESIIAWCKENTIITTQAVARELGFETKNLDQRVSKRIADILRSIGYERHQPRINGVKTWCWKWADPSGPKW